MDVFCVEKSKVVQKSCHSLEEAKGAALVILEEEGALASDCISEIRPGVFEWTRTIQVSGETQLYDRLRLRAWVCGSVDFYMIPGVNYNGNAWGEGKEPKGFYHEGKPWIFASHRAGVPGGMYAQNESAAVGMFGAHGNKSGFSCLIEPAVQGGLLLQLQFPEEEGPRIYSARDRYEEEIYRESVWWQQDVITIKAILTVSPNKMAYGYGFFLDTAWDYFRAEGFPVKTKENLWELGFDFIRNSAFFRDKDFCGFCMGLTFDQSGWVQKRDYLEIGWVGQNASLAVSLLYQSVIEGDEEPMRLGLEILDGWADQGVLPNGLFRCRFDKIQKHGKQIQNTEERNDAANLFSAVEEYLEAYRLLNLMGVKRDHYRRLALGICNFMVQVQREDGKLGKAWYNSGVCSDPEGTVGCYMAHALCLAYEETTDAVYLKSAGAAYDFYQKEFMADGYTTAGALDTYCVDKEAAIPLLGTALKLYEFTNKKRYLEEAEAVSYYLATWQYHYNVDFGSETILGRMGYLTRGGTAVSVQHHHIDCYGLAFYENWRLLARLTGHKIWEERAKAMWNNSLYNISEGPLIVKGQKRPRGSQDEGFLQTRWHTKKGEYFGVSEWLVVWNTAFRLKILRKEYLARKRGFDKSGDRI